MLDLKALPPLALYVHIPWCLRKCPYCDFNSHVGAKLLPEDRYVQALLTDLEGELLAIANRKIHSIFIGGGTPSLFSASAIDSLLSGLRARLRFSSDIEITLEANPGTVECQRLAEFKDCGINRLSLGVQSFNDVSLRGLSRIHSSREARLAIETAKDVNFKALNIDLMFGLPAQTEAQAIQDIQTALSYSPQHISHYQLTIEPDTAFAHRAPVLPDEEHIWSMQASCQRLLMESGYQQYEVSAYALATHQCRHNLNYWHFGDYVGIGAGAHQKITHLERQQIARCSKQRLPNSYMDSVDNAQHVLDQRLLSDDEIVFEFMLNALRLREGFSEDLFSRHTGLPLSVVSPVLKMAQEQNLIECTGRNVRPSEHGWRYLNELLLLFMK